MIGAHRVVGYAIVSADGMIADGAGAMPATLRNDADQKFLQAELDRAAAVVHGRHSHEGGPRAGRRKRLIVTRQITAIAVDPSQPNALLWNPAGASPEQAIAALGVGDGPIAVIGGSEVYALFLPLYDAFQLTRAALIKIPGGRPVFPSVGQDVTPEQVLADRGLAPSHPRDIDAAAGVSVTSFLRPDA